MFHFFYVIYLIICLNFYLVVYKLDKKEKTLIKIILKDILSAKYNDIDCLRKTHPYCKYNDYLFESKTLNLCVYTNYKYTLYIKNKKLLYPISINIIIYKIINSHYEHLKNKNCVTINTEKIEYLKFLDEILNKL